MAFSSFFTGYRERAQSRDQLLGVAAALRSGDKVDQKTLTAFTDSMAKAMEMSYLSSGQKNALKEINETLRRQRNTNEDLDKWQKGQMTRMIKSLNELTDDIGPSIDKMGQYLSNLGEVINKDEYKKEIKWRKSSLAVFDDMKFALHRANKIAMSNTQELKKEFKRGWKEAKAAQSAGLKEFFSALPSRVGGFAAKAMPYAGAALGATSIYDLHGKKDKGQSFFGQGQGEGGLLKSRAADYAGTAAGGAMLGATFGPLGAAIGAGIGLLTAAVVDNWTDIKKGSSDFFDATMDLAAKGWKFILPVLQTVGKELTDIWEKSFEPSLTSVKELVTEVFTDISKTSKNVWDTVLRPGFEWVGYTLNDFGMGVENLWEGFLKPTLSEVGDSMSTTWNVLLKPSLESMATAVSLVGDGLGLMYSSVKTLGEGFGWLIKRVGKFIGVTDTDAGDAPSLDAVRGKAAVFGKTATKLGSQVAGVAAGTIGAATPQLAKAVQAAGSLVGAPSLGAKGAAMVSSAGAAVGGALGSLSARFESSKDGPATVGYDGTGGTSYGTYQIASKTGTMGQFLNYLSSVNPEWAKRLAAAGDPNTGSRNGPFPNVWRQIAKEDPKGFDKAQHDFIQKTLFNPAARQLAADGIDVSSSAMRDVLWSTVVQHGTKGAVSIFRQAYKQASGQGEKGVISAIYALRRGKFGSSTSAVQASVQRRFDQESQIALAMSDGKSVGTGAAVGAVAASPTQESYSRVASTSGTPQVNVMPPPPVPTQSSGTDGANKVAMTDIPFQIDDLGLVLINSGSVS